MEIYLSLLIALIGLLMYVLVTTQAKVAELGRLMFAFGLLAFLICMCNSPHPFGVIAK